MLHKNLRKKGQGLSLNVIIIAVIALLVLVVIVFIFTGKSRTFTKGVASCKSQGGICVTDQSQCTGPVVGTVSAGDISCDANNNGVPNEGGDDGTICCVSLG